MHFFLNLRVVESSSSEGGTDPAALTITTARDEDDWQRPAGVRGRAYRRASADASDLGERRAPLGRPFRARLFLAYFSARADGEHRGARSSREGWHQKGLGWGIITGHLRVAAGPRRSPLACSGI